MTGPITETPAQRTRRHIAALAQARGGTVAQVLGRSRRAVDVRVRHGVIRDLAEVHPDWSTTQIGHVVGRDHTTICFILGRCRRRLPADMRRNREARL